MKILKKHGSGSMFSHFFFLTTSTVLFCIIVTGFALLLFLVNFWKEERLSLLTDNASSLARSVDIIVDEKGYSSNSLSENMLTDKKYSLSVANAVITIGGDTEADLILFDSDGKVLFCSDVTAETAHDGGHICEKHFSESFYPEILSAITASGLSGFSTEGKLSNLDDTNYLFSSVPVVINNNIVCYSAAEINLLQAYREYTVKFFRIILTTVLISVFITFITSLIVSYRMTKPVKKLTEATKKMSSGDFSGIQNADRSYNEIAELTDAFNTMSESLAVIDESRSNFVSNISHELKTPLTVIGGFVDGILDGTIPENESRKYLDIVSDETKRLSTLVIGMLNLSRVEAGKQALNFTSFYINETVIRTLIRFEKRIDEKKIEITGLDSFNKTQVNADSILISQVIYNLIDNAVKFSEIGGNIDLRLKHENSKIIFSVRNSGKGISEKDLPFIFERFYKTDKSRSLDSKSFGLGLYIVKKIIDLHSGTVTCNSDSETYTEFSISFPDNLDL